MIAVAAKDILIIGAGVGLAIATPLATKFLLERYHEAKDIARHQKSSDPALNAIHDYPPEVYESILNGPKNPGTPHSSLTEPDCTPKG